MSEPTYFLADPLLHNSVEVMTKQKTELGVSEYPLYTHGELAQLVHRWQACGLNKPWSINGYPNPKKEPLTFTFHDAGHILGSVGIQLNHRGREHLLHGRHQLRPADADEARLVPDEGHRRPHHRDDARLQPPQGEPRAGDGEARHQDRGGLRPGRRGDDPRLRDGEDPGDAGGGLPPVEEGPDRQAAALHRRPGPELLRGLRQARQARPALPPGPQAPQPARPRGDGQQENPQLQAPQGRPLPHLLRDDDREDPLEHPRQQVPGRPAQRDLLRRLLRLGVPRRGASSARRGRTTWSSTRWRARCR